MQPLSHSLHRPHDFSLRKAPVFGANPLTDFAKDVPCRPFRFIFLFAPAVQDELLRKVYTNLVPLFPFFVCHPRQIFVADLSDQEFGLSPGDTARK